MAKVKEYPLTSLEGIITFEQPFLGKGSCIEGVLGIQIAKDGRVWICLDGIALIRFKPKLKGSGYDKKNSVG